MPTIIHDAHMMTDANQATLTLEQTRSGTVTMQPDLLCRDGIFELDRQWLIWEREDLERIAGWLLDPMKGLQAFGYRIGEIAIPMPERRQDHYGPGASGGGSTGIYFGDGSSGYPGGLGRVVR